MAKETTKQKRNNLIVGNTGMYFVAYQLSRRGWNVMPTSRNARGIDLVAYDANGRKFLGIQIKTLSRGRNAVPLGLDPHLLGDWWIIVTNVGNIAENENPECFVLTPAEVKRGAVQDEGGAQAFWLPWDNYSKARFKDWGRIGRGDAAIRRRPRLRTASQGRRAE